MRKFIWLNIKKHIGFSLINYDTKSNSLLLVWAKNIT